MAVAISPFYTSRSTVSGLSYRTPPKHSRPVLSRDRLADFFRNVLAVRFGNPAGHGDVRTGFLVPVQRHAPFDSRRERKLMYRRHVAIDARPGTPRQRHLVGHDHDFVLLERPFFKGQQL